MFQEKKEEEKLDSVQDSIDASMSRFEDEIKKRAKENDLHRTETTQMTQGSIKNHY